MNHAYQVLTGLPELQSQQQKRIEYGYEVLKGERYEGFLEGY